MKEMNSPALTDEETLKDQQYIKDKLKLLQLRGSQKRGELTEKERKQLMDFLAKYAHEKQIPLEEVVKLLLKINKYAHAEIAERQRLSTDPLPKKEKFEIDMLFFSQWFQENEQAMRARYEFFYGPQTENA